MAKVYKLGPYKPNEIKILQRKCKIEGVPQGMPTTTNNWLRYVVLVSIVIFVVHMFEQEWVQEY